MKDIRGAVSGKTTIRRRLLTAGAGLALLGAAMLTVDPGVALAERISHEPPPAAAAESSNNDPNNQSDPNGLNPILSDQSTLAQSAELTLEPAK